MFVVLGSVVGLTLDFVEIPYREKISYRKNPYREFTPLKFHILQGFLNRKTGLWWVGEFAVGHMSIVKLANFKIF